MGKFVRGLCSAVLLGGTAAFVWTSLLNDRAKDSLKRAGQVGSQLANHVVSSYMANGQGSLDENAIKQNQEWINEQWRQAGF